MNSNLTKSIVKSSWTPLNNEGANSKIFEERRSLINKWFEMWNSTQRRIIIDDILSKCTANQAEYAKTILITKAPQIHVDFTRTMPRVLCLYIFSFLDPRSLCRASQVCWYWKYLTETNEIWAPKCARLGWYFTGPVNTMEQGLWKKHFIQNIIFLQITKPSKELTALELTKRTEEEEAQRKARKLHDKQMKAQKLGTVPWRGPDPKPIDIIRNNYIENDYENGARMKMSRPDSKRSSSRNTSLDKTHTNSKVNRPMSSQQKESINQKVDTEEQKIETTNRSIMTASENKQQQYKIIDATIGVHHDSYVNGADIPSGRPWILPTEQAEI